MNYLLALAIHNLKDGRKKVVYITGIILNVGVLAYCKYANFFIGNINELSMWAGWPGKLNSINILLPVGLSFLTFQSISYLIEVKRGGITVERNLVHLANYFLFFPKMFSGPIERPGPFLAQLKKPLQTSPALIESGLRLCLMGFFKKLVVADRLADYVNKVYDAPGSFGSNALIAATVFFTIQLYCDFSGYCDIGMGISQMLGIKLTQNFRHPLFAVSFSDFWKRWHITLASWLRDYVFIPLCGRRAKRTQIYRNIFIVFAISGLWHGANWTFIFWGMLHGTFIIIGDIKDRFWNKYVNLELPEWLLKVCSIITTFVLVAFTRIFFKSNSLSEALLIIKRILTVPGPSEFDITGRFFLFLAIALIILYEIKSEFFKEKLSIWQNPSMVLRCAFVISLSAIILLLGVFQGSTFIYTKF